MSIFDIASRYEDGEYKASQVIKLSEAILNEADYFNELPDIPGVALMIPPYSEMLSNINVNIFVDANRVIEINPTQTLPIMEVEGMYTRILKYLGYEPEWLKDIRLFGIDEPIFQLQPGEMVSSGMQRGTSGCKLTWQGRNGFATAGHVAPTVGTHINDNAGFIGDVVWSNDPRGHGKSIEADFAVIEILSNLSFPNNSSGYAQAQPYDDVYIKSLQEFKKTI